MTESAWGLRGKIPIAAVKVGLLGGSRAQACVTMPFMQQLRVDDAIPLPAQRYLLSCMSAGWLGEAVTRMRAWPGRCPMGKAVLLDPVKENTAARLVAVPSGL